MIITKVLLLLLFMMYCFAFFLIQDTIFNNGSLGKRIITYTVSEKIKTGVRSHIWIILALYFKHIRCHAAATTVVGRGSGRSWVWLLLLTIHPTSLKDLSQ